MASLQKTPVITPNLSFYWTFKSLKLIGRWEEEKSSLTPKMPVTSEAGNTIRKQAYSNILKISPPKTEGYQTDKHSDIFHVSAQNIDCGYSLEHPQK